MSNHDLMYVFIRFTVFSNKLIQILWFHDTIWALKFRNLFLRNLMEHILKLRAFDMAIESTFTTMEHSAFNLWFFLIANMALVFVVLIDSALITKSKVFCELKINLFLLYNIHLQILDNRFTFEEVLSMTHLTLKTFITFPSTIWHTGYLWWLASSVKSLVTFITIKKLIFSFCWAAFLTVFTVLTFPIKSKFLYFWFWNFDTVVVEWLST